MLLYIQTVYLRKDNKQKLLDSKLNYVESATKYELEQTHGSGFRLFP